MDRPVVVNSLLCFIHNFRETLHTHQLRSLVDSYFTKSTVSLAEKTLLGFLSPHEVNSALDLVALYDRVIKHSQSLPIFAADDLGVLPLTITSDDIDTASEILREVRQLKESIQELLGARLDELGNVTRSSDSAKDSRKQTASPSSPESISNHNNSDALPSLRNNARPPLGRRKGGSGHKLDAMVRKLTESRQREKAMESLASPIWTPQVMNTVAYVNFLRTVSRQPPIFPVVTTSQSVGDNLSYTNNDSATEIEAKPGDQSLEVIKKEVESSPSPSNVSNHDLINNFTDLNDKPYRCAHSNCNKRFANKFLLKKHQFIHTGLRPHRCPYCGKRFNRKDNLLRHKKTHLSAPITNDLASLACEEILSNVGRQLTMQMSDQNENV